MRMPSLGKATKKVAKKVAKKKPTKKAVMKKAAATMGAAAKKTKVNRNISAGYSSTRGSLASTKK